MHVAAVVALVALAAAPSVDFGTPAPAIPSTTRLAVATGSGDQRLSLWTAMNAGGELCLGSRLGASTAPPASFTCLRRGLERPVLTVEGGGGQGGQVTWGALTGVASRTVARVSVTEGASAQTQRDLELTPLRGFPGWRVFTTGIETRPPNVVDTYGAGGELTRDVGIWIHPPLSAISSGTATAPGGVVPVITVPSPPVNGQMPAASGTPWTSTFARLGWAGESATTLALSLPAVRNVLAHHHAWLEQTVRWSTCGGRALGYVVSFRFTPAASFTAVLPSIGSTKGFAYATGTQRVRANAWTELNVSVDTNVGAVVGVDSAPRHVPNNAEGTTTVLQTIVPLHPGGGPDPQAADCSHD